MKQTKPLIKILITTVLAVCFLIITSFIAIQTLQLQDTAKFTYYFANHKVSLFTDKIYTSLTKMAISANRYNARFIQSANDCPFLYTYSSDAESKIFGSIEFYSQSFPNLTQKYLEGSCLYIKTNGEIHRLNGYSNWRSLQVMDFLLQKYVLVGRECGAGCYIISIININTGEENVLTSGLNFQFSPDGNWLINCQWEVHTNGLNDSDIDPNLCEAISMNDLRRYEFANNPYYDQSSWTANLQKISGYHLSDEANCKSSIRNDCLYEFKKDGVVSVIFFDDNTRQYTTRSFLINESFKEKN